MDHVQYRGRFKRIAYHGGAGLAGYGLSGGLGPSVGPPHSVASSAQSAFSLQTLRAQLGPAGTFSASTRGASKPHRHTPRG